VTARSGDYYKQRKCPEGMEGLKLRLESPFSTAVPGSSPQRELVYLQIKNSNLSANDACILRLPLFVIPVEKYITAGSHKYLLIRFLINASLCRVYLRLRGLNYLQYFFSLPRSKGGRLPPVCFCPNSPALSKNLVCSVVDFSLSSQ